MKRTIVAMLASVLLVATSISAASAAPSDTVGPDVPADAAERVAAVDAALGIDTPWRDALQRAIDPADYECEATEFYDWIDDLLARTNLAVLNTIEQYAVSAWPTYYTALFDDDPSDDTVGVDGSQTREQRTRHKDAQRFWDVPTDDVRLHGMHGADIADDAKMVPTVQALFGVGAGTAQAVVDFVQAQIEAEPTIGYDHPYFTLNAFAIEGGEILPGLVIPDKIVMGDGVLTALDELGIGDNGPDFVHAHEFAHHVQFEIGAFDSPLPAPEATRRTELMADAFAAYNLAHARGATFQTKRITEAIVGAYDVGDCSFTNSGHHGTPNQREAAATWGAGLAQDARPQGMVSSALDLFDRFEVQLPILLEPDA
ncbi:neutral zinc metallopeptidase [Salsipaludibacter albus]|uniref:neutral zinc metallopeptidase n=1 Tax=Salsipaludibacter albus TaxID=2849650 RepID=UPI001EE3E7CC|nr:neutral zinc metallopeptidase [Salsipaludibacter albus]MBY5163507.1 neutral zinc metallopeptidase [Salsipaludibacter albus]